MATVKQVIERAYTKVNGEYETMLEASDDFKTYLNVLNQVMDTWFRTPYVKWQTLFDADYTLPDVVADGQLIYPVANATDIKFGNTPFDTISFILDGVTIKQYKMTDQAFFGSSNVSNICMLASDGLHLKTVPDEIIGTTIKMPAYLPPPTYTLGSQTVVIDSIPWLIAAMSNFVCASSPVPFIARNADRYEKEADKAMKEMRDNNRRLQHLIIKRAGGSLTDQSNATLSSAITGGYGAGGGLPSSIDGGEF